MLRSFFLLIKMLPQAVGSLWDFAIMPELFLQASRVHRICIL